MSYRIIMVWAIQPCPPWNYPTAEARLMYEPKRSHNIEKAYTNCVIPMTSGYKLVCI